MEAIAKFDFTASGEDELSFQAGDILKVLSSQEEWYKAELRSQEGYVPKNFIDFHVPPATAFQKTRAEHFSSPVLLALTYRCPEQANAILLDFVPYTWFDEKISRHEAESILMSKGVGSFIVRASQNSHGDFSISVRHEDDVQHFKVMRDSKGNYYLWTEKFYSLNKLVDYYKTSTISKQKQILLRDDSREEKERRGGSLERMSRDGLHMGGAVGEAHSSMSKRYVDHPVPVLHQQQDRYGGSLDRKDALHGLRYHSQGSAAAVQRRHTDPLHQQTPRILWVRALYDFDAVEHDELGFRSGDIVEVLDSSNPSWWKGRLRGELGLFPANYVTPVLL